MEDRERSLDVGRLASQRRMDALLPAMREEEDAAAAVAAAEESCSSRVVHPSATYPVRLRLASVDVASKEGSQP